MDVHAVYTSIAEEIAERIMQGVAVCHLCRDHVHVSGEGTQGEGPPFQHLRDSSGQKLRRRVAGTDEDGMCRGIGRRAGNGCVIDEQNLRADRRILQRDAAWKPRTVGHCAPFGLVYPKLRIRQAEARLKRRRVEGVNLIGQGAELAQDCEPCRRKSGSIIGYQVKGTVKRQS